MPAINGTRLFLDRKCLRPNGAGSGGGHRSIYVGDWIKGDFRTLVVLKAREIENIELKSLVFNRRSSFDIGMIIDKLGRKKG